MGLFSRLVSKRKKTEVEELFSDIQEESKLFEEFLDKHEEKISFIKEVTPNWDKGNISYISTIIRDIFLFNKELKRLTERILELEKNDEKLFLFIIKEKLNQIEYPSRIFRPHKSVIDRKKAAMWVKELKPIFDKLFDFLGSLSRLISLQTETIKGWGSSGPARLAKDLLEKEFFYQLLVNEAHLDRMIKHHLQIIIRGINSFLGYEKVYRRPRKERITKGVVFHDIRDVKSLTFKQFYVLYNKSFREEQQDPESFFKKFLRYQELKVDIKEGATRTHLVVGTAEGKIVALTYFSVNFVKERNICFGVGWYRVVAEEHRRMGISNALHEYRLGKMRSDAKRFGVKDVDAIFSEVNDPKKMQSQGIKSEPTDLDPYENMKIMQKMGFFKMNYQHIQPPIDADAPVTYSIMMIQPFNPQWIARRGIPLQDMEKIWYYYVKYGYESNPKIWGIYQQVLKNIRESQINGYVTFGWW